MKTAAEIEIRPLGDSAIIVQLAEPGATPDDASLEAVLRVQRALRSAELPGVTEITIAFTTVALFYNPAHVGVSGGAVFTSLETQIRSVLEDFPDDKTTAVVEQRTHDVPVCYDGEFALDLEDVARNVGLEPAEVIARHSSAEYRVACIGFTPGFPYLLGLPPELAVPRRESPRTAVPAGSVAIGGTQAGIYPLQSPGGWHVLGRTPIRLFDASSETPSALHAGDRVHFRQISRAEFHRLTADGSVAPVQAPANK